MQTFSGKWDETMFNSRFKESISLLRDFVLEKKLPHPQEHFIKTHP